MTKALELVGLKFSRLTVISQEPSKNGRTRWLCVCDCGKNVVVDGKSLTSGNTKSCGCQKRDSAIKFNHETKRRHGESFSRLYKIWHSMKCRCSQDIFKNHKGRGIRVCEEWLRSYESFRDWAILNGYRDDLTIDRIDVNKNYEPNDCQWATTKEQSRNKRTNRIILGKTLVEWSEITGLNSSTIAGRIDKLGWSEKKAISTPIRGAKGRGVRENDND